VRVSTTGYGGRTITETVSIQTNDTGKPHLNVTLTGFVEKVVDISPNRAMLVGEAGKPLAKKIRITPQKGYPMKILNARAKSGEFIKLNLEEVKSAGKTSYLLHIENLKQEKGRYHDMIYIDTDSPNLPRIQIYVIGNIVEK
jgi:hypothetical protein